MPKLDTHDMDVVAGAIYFVVGRGTEGGPASYHLDIAGITSGTADPYWGKTDHVRADSGYSLGAIQVDLGKRGTWTLGSTKETAPASGERTYVDAIIDESAKYANENGLKYTSNRAQLRADLLTHGNGQSVSSTLSFVDTDTRDSINAWASSKSGQQWIHKNIDYPQIKHATQSAMDLLDKYGGNITEDHRLEAIAILAKTENQLPAKVRGLERVLSGGGDYRDLLAEAQKIKGHYESYDGLKAANLAEKYDRAHLDTETAAALDRAQAKVASADFNPATASMDPDIQQALRTIGQGSPVHLMRLGSHGDQVFALQTELVKLGITDAHGRALSPDGAFGPNTQAAVRTFQRMQGLESDGIVGPDTLRPLEDAARQQTASLADRSHPGNPMFCQALERVHAIDTRHGRTPDTLSDNLAGALATAAYAQGLGHIDHVLLGDDATRAFAVQGDPRSPSRQMACVDVMQAIATPLEQSSAGYLALSQMAGPQPANGAQPARALAGPALEDMHR